MANRRARRPDLTKALALEMLKGQSGCFWCGGKLDPSTASIEYKVPPKNETTSNELVCICEICTHTEVRRVRFPRGLLISTSKNPEVSFSEMVRLSLSEYVIRNRRNLESKEMPEVDEKGAGIAELVKLNQQMTDWLSNRPDFLFSNSTEEWAFGVEAKSKEGRGIISDTRNRNWFDEWVKLDGNIPDELRDIINEMLLVHPGDAAHKRFLEVALWNLVKDMQKKQESEIDG